ncbi:MAG: helix-hairpin-helix domain-containing protein [Bacteroidetes bacterium]|nr:helix-hairpin-helix domain-containing protein [Bacteroidota bacterium]
MKNCYSLVKFVLLLVTFMVVPTILFAQEKETKQDIQQKIENAAENAESEETDFTILLEELQYYIQHPINLNYTDREELLRLELLSDLQINNLLKHIEKNGKLMTIYELQTIESFDLDVISKILPYVKVENNFDNPNVSMKEIFKYGKFQFVSRYQQVIEQQLGYYTANNFSDSMKLESPNSYYLGPQFKLYERLNFVYTNKINFGIVAEKDPGEEFLKALKKMVLTFTLPIYFLKNLEN